MDNIEVRKKGDIIYELSQKMVVELHDMLESIEVEGLETLKELHKDKSEVAGLLMPIVTQMGGDSTTAMTALKEYLDINEGLEKDRELMSLLFFAMKGFLLDVVRMSVIVDNCLAGIMTDMEEGGDKK